MSEIKPDKVIDVKGLRCPMPLFKTKKALKNMQPGQVLEVIADDQTTKSTLSAYLEHSGDELLGIVEEKGTIHHFIKKHYKIT